MSVRIEKKGPVFTVILSRPEVRNAVDRDTAAALADAFREFENDPGSSVAVLWGEGGMFCAGADLESLAAGNGPTAREDGDGPMGPSRMQLSKPDFEDFRSQNSTFQEMAATLRRIPRRSSG